MSIKIDNTNEMSKSTAAVWFWSVVVFFAVVWVLLPTFLLTGYRGDVIEPLNVAPEWVWSTKKHPMLPAWMLEILNILTCRSFAVPFIATQLCTLLALWSVWKLARTVLSKRLALIATFSMLPYTFFTIKPVWFNQNNVLIPLWALSIYLVFQAFQTNQKRYWIGAGIALGLTFHAKYTAVFLVVSILVYMFARNNGRKYLMTPGPYITTLIAFLIFLPHIIWLFYHDFVTFSYATGEYGKAAFMEQWNRHIWSPIQFVLLQLVYLLLPLICLIPMIGCIWQWKVQHREQGKAKECERFLFYCFIIPLAFHLLYCGIKGIFLPMAYGAAFWSFSGLWLLLRFQTATNTLRSFRQAAAWAITIMLLIAGGFATLAHWGHKHPNLHFPMRELGTTCEQLWSSHFPDINCPYIAGDNHVLFGHAAHFMSVRPSVIVPWGTWANDDDLNQKGGMIAWERDGNEKSMPESLRHRFPTAEVLPETPDLPYKIGREIRTLNIGVAIVPPAVIPWGYEQ